MPGDTLYLYTGMRTKQCEQIIAPVRCSKVEEIRIEMRPSRSKRPLTRGLIFPHVFIEGCDLTGDEKDLLAYADGFDSFAEMMEFWEGRLPFKGDIIYWK